MRRPTFLVALPLLAACSGRPPPPATTPPARVVSLAPSITEIVYALGAGDRLVGVCAQCDYPAAAARLPRVGGYLVPSVEAVVAARPDVVLVVPSPGNRDAVRAVEQAGVRVVVVQDRTLAGLATVPAVRDGRVVAFAGEAIFRAGPRVPDAARALAAAIHPEAFGAG